MAGRTALASAIGSAMGWIILCLVAQQCAATPAAAPAAAAQGGGQTEDVLLAAIVKRIRPAEDLSFVGTSTVIKYGSMIDLDCHQKPGAPGGEGVSWLKNGKPFRNGRDSRNIGWLAASDQVYQDYQIRFFNFTLADAGNYTCVTPKGTVTALLTVAPKIVPLTFAKIVKAGEKLTLSCEAQGFPQPQTSWVLPNMRVRRHGQLVLNASYPRHNGTFTCVAKNIAGEVNSSINVIVKDPVRFLRKPVTSLPISDSVAMQLDCAATGNPTPTYQWLVRYAGERSYVVLPGRNQSTLTVAPATRAGQFRCDVFSTFTSHENASPEISHVFHVGMVVGGASSGELGNTEDCDTPECSGTSTTVLSTTLALAMLLSRTLLF